MRRLTRIVAIIPVLILLGACSTLPNADGVARFGKAVTASTTVMEDAIALSARIQMLDEAEIHAQSFVRGGPVALSVGTVPLLPKEQIELRLQLLSALGGYGKALADAADNGNVAKLEAAAAKLGGAATSLAAVLSPTTAPIAGPAIRLVSRGVGILLGNAYAAEIQAVISARDADVKQAATLLRRSLGTVRSVLRRQHAVFTDSRSDSLSLIRGDRRIDRLRAYDEWRRARQEVAEISAALAAVDRYDQVLTALEDSHHALATGKPDGEQLLRRFVDLSDDIAALATAIRRTP
ncbi:hypothetical protein [Phreatobacter sp.]|uniref:hypothetical protein n=1 Tax=Phreatobacter sp. TaxID=1966341 RepID=UPI0022CBABDF|nr:hypothetical protein [Phreatobacter sp.]MCZ8315539.1 hypothetical protein [Phreatobacter sp.]